MAQLIKTNLFILFLFVLSLTSECQTKNFKCLKIISDIEKMHFNDGDTIRIVLENPAGSPILYQMDVMMCYHNDWIYSPYYTRYFNRDLTYKELLKVFDSKYPIVFPQDYKHIAILIEPKKTIEISFLTSDGNFPNDLIRFRFKIVDGGGECKMIYSRPFFFRKLAW